MVMLNRNVTEFKQKRDKAKDYYRKRLSWYVHYSYDTPRVENGKLINDMCHYVEVTINLEDDVYDRCIVLSDSEIKQLHSPVESILEYLSALQERFLDETIKEIENDS